MGLFEGLFRAIHGTAKLYNNQQLYEHGYEDGRSGKPRHFIGMRSERGVEMMEFYNRGYEDGMKQQMLDKLD